MNWTDEDDELARQEGWFICNGGYWISSRPGPFITIMDLLIHLEAKAPESDLHYRAFMDTRWSGAFNELAFRKGYRWALGNGTFITQRSGGYLTQEERFELIQITANEGCLLSQKALKVLSTRKLKGR